MNKYFILLSVFSLLLVTACSGRDEDDRPPLEGDRLSIFDLEKDSAAQSSNISAAQLPELWANNNWPQAGGYPNHSMQNLSFAGNAPQKVWKADIGEGATKKIPLTAQPIIVSGRVFTLDARSNISAFVEASGEKIWRLNIRPEKRKEAVISGGISFANNILYATSGYSEVVAINPLEGKIIWRTNIKVPSRAAPTISEGRVFVTTLNNTTYALDSLTGKILWEHESAGNTTSLLGAASPAVDEDMVIVTLSSGDIIALRVQNGSVLWSDSLSNPFRLGGISGLSDIRGLPIIDSDMVIAISYGGKMMALDKATGRRLWQRDVSSSETPWIAGQNIYITSADHALVALNRQNGSIYWTKPLPKYENEKKKKGVIHWAGPVIAGNRLMLVGSHGELLEFSATDGSLIRETALAKEGVNIAPIVANNTLYLLSNDGSLISYR